MNGRYSMFDRKPSRLEKAELRLSELIDIMFGIHALLIAKGLVTFEETSKMVDLVRHARVKLGKDFTVEEGLKAIIAQWRIELK